MSWGGGDCDVFLLPLYSSLISLSPADCHDFGLDAVILFDSSQSISKSDFDTMITFIKDIVRMFTDTSVQVSGGCTVSVCAGQLCASQSDDMIYLSQVAVAQYSTDAHAVFHFQNFAVDRNPDNLMKLVTHSEGNTYTPSAIRYVL